MKKCCTQNLLAEIYHAKQEQAIVLHVLCMLKLITVN